MTDLCGHPTHPSDRVHGRRNPSGAEAKGPTRTAHRISSAAATHAGPRLPSPTQRGSNPQARIPTRRAAGRGELAGRGEPPGRGEPAGRARRSTDSRERQLRDAQRWPTYPSGSPTAAASGLPRRGETTHDGAQDWTGSPDCRGRIEWWPGHDGGPSRASFRGRASRSNWDEKASRRAVSTDRTTAVAAYP